MDVGEAFVRLLRERPPTVSARVANPCVDCKILMMRKARELMKKWGASFLISGEVLGQRPCPSAATPSMSSAATQRLRSPSSVRSAPNCSIRPAPEISGLVDRNKLLGIFGRGRKSQMALADQMGLKEIPTPPEGANWRKRKTPVLAGPDAPQRADG
ncbi:MAG: hypothetical protein ACLSHC_01415 [Bilophila wadsworthia]